MSKINLNSSINKVGKVVTQIFHFSNGEKRTFSCLIPSTIKEGKFTKIYRTDGSVLSVNPNNVDCFETFPEGVEIPEEDLEETGGSALETMSRMEAEIRNLNSQLQAFKEAFESLGEETQSKGQLSGTVKHLTIEDLDNSGYPDVTEQLKRGYWPEKDTYEADEEAYSHV